MSNYHELLLGCGHSRVKRINPFDGGSANPGTPKEWQCLTTLDIDPECNPDIRFDLSKSRRRISFDTGHEIPDSYFDEIHAYEVLEHIGGQGDYHLFFEQFREFWRILKSDGYFVATVPDYRSVWAWGDPGHTRVINMGTLVFLSQAQYSAQLGKTPMSDYQALLSPADFEIVRAKVVGETLQFVLRAIK